MKIADLAQFVTSKNAGPFLLTVDIVFGDSDTYQRFKAMAPLTKAGVAELYGLDADQVLDIIPFDPAYAFKITMRRPWGLRGRGRNRCLRSPATHPDRRVRHSMGDCLLTSSPP